jgi:hypothetical protein
MKSQNIQFSQAPQIAVRSLKVLSILGLAVFALSQSMNAEAAQSSRSKKSYPVSRDSVSVAAAAPASAEEPHYSSRSETRWGLGLASVYNMTVSDAALTGWIGLSPRFGIQPLLSIGSTSPFNFAAGALAKYTLVQHGAGGFHIGGGATFGSIHKGATNGGLLFFNTGGTNTSNGFNMALAALIGVHFEMPSAPNIMLHFDGGANFGLRDGDTDFNVGAIGGLLGASIIYVF